MTNYQNITGEQLGAYFGYAVATADVDGDSLDDLIIGAPLHTEPNGQKEYEVGRVYVMYQGSSSAVSFTKFGTFRAKLLTLESYRDDLEGCIL